MSLELDILLLLFSVGFFAGLIDAIAGGGGLLTIPALLFAGINPATALATNKLQSTFGSFTASYYFFKKKMVNPFEIKWLIFLTFIGSFLGSFLILQIDSTLLKNVIPFLLIIIGIYFLLSPNIGSIDKEKRIYIFLFGIFCAFVIGFYDGFFGPGTGSFFAIAFIAMLGYNLTKATAHAKVLNFISNLASLILFMIIGEILWDVGIIMGIGQLLGALIGARLVLKNGQKLIRPIVVIISFLISIKLLIS